MSIVALTQKRERLTAQTPVRYTDAEMARLDAMSEELGIPRAHIIRAATLAMFEEMDSGAPSPRKKRRQK